MLSLKQVFDSYTSLAEQSGEPVPLSAFNLSSEETSRLFSVLDEDYHISRFLQFSCAAGQRYLVAGEPVTHVKIDPAISSLL